MLFKLDIIMKASQGKKKTMLGNYCSLSDKRSFLLPYYIVLFLEISIQAQFHIKLYIFIYFIFLSNNVNVSQISKENGVSPIYLTKDGPLKLLYRLQDDKNI